MTRALPTLAGFTALGLFYGAWAAVLPSVQNATGASNGELGAALLFLSVGSVPAMLFLAGPAVDRWGKRAVVVACAAFAAATALPGLATSLPVLGAALVVTGAASGVLDVGINANVSRLETETGRRLMPLAHGLFSVGVLVGAASAGLARSAGAGREAILLGVSALIGVAAALLAADRSAIALGAPRRPRLERGLLAIGIVAAFAFLVEGALEGWSAIFLERKLDAGPALSGLGPAVFAGAMAAGRFSGQVLRLGDRTLLSGGAALSAVGCLVTAAAPVAPVALLGLALGGAGVSLAAPILFGAAGRNRPDAASAIATVTTIGYLGLLTGPPLVGGVAEAISLRGSFAMLAVLAALVAVAASRLRL